MSKWRTRFPCRDCTSNGGCDIMHHEGETMEGHDCAMFQENRAPWREDHKKFRCTQCGAIGPDLDGAWRWNGRMWEHACENRTYPQEGHYPCEPLPEEDKTVCCPSCKSLRVFPALREGVNPLIGTVYECHDCEAEFTVLAPGWLKHMPRRR